MPLVGFAQRAGDLDRSFNFGRGENYGFNYGGQITGVKSIAIQPDHKIVIGGEFLLCNGVFKYQIARLNSDGGLDTSFTQERRVNRRVTTVVIQTNGKIIIGGRSGSGLTRNFIARLNVNGSSDASFTQGTGPNGLINSFIIQTDGKIISR